MYIFVGLTDECPTEEGIEVFTFEDFPVDVVEEDAQGTRYITASLTDPDVLAEWASDTYEIWTLKAEEEE